MKTKNRKNRILLSINNGVANIPVKLNLENDSNQKIEAMKSDI